jgi:type III secretion system-like peptide-binding chaperone
MHRWNVEIQGRSHTVELDAARLGHPSHFRFDGVRYRIGGRVGRRRTTSFLIDGTPATIVRHVVIPPWRQRLRAGLGGATRGLPKVLFGMALGLRGAAGAGSLDMAEAVLAEFWVIYELSVGEQPQGSWVAPTLDKSQWTFVPPGGSLPDGKSLWVVPTGTDGAGANAQAAALGGAAPRTPWKTEVIAELATADKRGGILRHFASKRRNAFVQIRVIDGTIEAEAVSNRFLTGANALDDAKLRQLSELGWADPDREHPNHRRTWVIEGDLERGEVLDVLDRTLRRVYGLRGVPTAEVDHRTWKEADKRASSELLALLSLPVIGVTVVAALVALAQQFSPWAVVLAVGAGSLGVLFLKALLSLSEEIPTRKSVRGLDTLALLALFVGPSAVTLLTVFVLEPAGLFWPTFALAWAMPVIREGTYRLRDLKPPPIQRGPDGRWFVDRG